MPESFVPILFAVDTPGGPMVNVWLSLCEFGCGAAVFDQEAHREWHERTANTVLLTKDQRARVFDQDHRADEIVIDQPALPTGDE